MANRYEENVCEMLRRKGLAPKYEHPGIYCIKLDDEIVYIGKAGDSFSCLFLISERGSLAQMQFPW